MLFFYALLSLVITSRCSQFVLKHITISQNPQSFTLPYSSVLSTNSPSFAYFIQSGKINHKQCRIYHNQSSTSITNSKIIIVFHVQGLTSLTTIQFIKITVLITDFDSLYVALGVETILISSTNIFNILLPARFLSSQNTFQQVNGQCFVLNLPMTYTYSLGTNRSNIIITINNIPTAINYVSISYFFITKNYLMNNIGVFFSKIYLGNLTWNIVFNSPQTIINPSLQNTFVGIRQYYASGLNIMDSMLAFNFLTSSTSQNISIGYTINSGSPITLNATLFMFNNDYNGCQGSYFLEYDQLYSEAPVDCSACHSKCKTCGSSNYSLSLTDQYSCLSCNENQYLKIINQNYGECICLPGLQQDTAGNCLPCSYNCLTFQVYFIRTSTQPEFFLVFSSAIANKGKKFQENLEIFVDETTNSLPYKFQNKGSGVYSIILQPSDLKSCQSQCQLNFYFSYPQLITRTSNDGQSLSQRNKIIQIQSYYSVQDLLPEELNQGLGIGGIFLGASMSGGLSSLFKMLFQLEQMIEFHKYISLQLPVVFKQFIQALNAFKFLDVTTIFNVENYASQLSNSQFDNKGPIQAIYYGFGCNFYKNISSLLISLAFALLINFAVFLLFRIIPCQVFKNLSQKMKARRLVTLLDLIDTIILPTIVFFQFQMSYINLSLQYFWIYSLMTIMVFSVISLPFIVATFIYYNRHFKKRQQVYEDVMQDCDIHLSGSYIFYLASYLRKVIFAFSLSTVLPGSFQCSIIIVVNFSYLLLTIYAVHQRFYKSKAKMLIKIINSLCVLGIQFIMLFYNFYVSSLTLMIQLGTTCVYLALIATIAGLFQIIIKLFELMCHKNQSQAEKQQGKSNSNDQILSVQPEKQFIKDKISCNIGKEFTQNILRNRQFYNKKSLFEKKTSIGDRSVFPQQYNPNQLISLDSLDSFEPKAHSRRAQQKKIEKDKNNAYKFIQRQVSKNQSGRKQIQSDNLQMIYQKKKKQSQNQKRENKKDLDKQILQIQDRLRNKRNKTINQKSLLKKYGDQFQSKINERNLVFQNDLASDELFISQTKRIKNQDLQPNFNQKRTRRRKNDRSNQIKHTESMTIDYKQKGTQEKSQIEEQQF